MNRPKIGEVSTPFNNPYSGQSYWPSFGKRLILKPQDHILIEQGGGGTQAFKIYQRLLDDPYVRADFSKLTHEIVSREWAIEPYSDKAKDKRVANFVTKVLSALKFDDVCKGLLDAYICNISVAEILWSIQEDGTIWPFAIKPKDIRAFQLEYNPELPAEPILRIKEGFGDWEGKRAPERKFILFRYYEQGSDDEHGHGVGASLYHPVLFMRRAIESWLISADRQAQPIIVGSVPNDATADDIVYFNSLIDNITETVSAVLPAGGFKIEAVNSNGDPAMYEKIIEVMRDMISMVILGEASTGRNGVGSHAKDEISNSIRIMKAKELSEALNETLTKTLIRWIVFYNYGPNVPTPRLVRRFEEAPVSNLTMNDIKTLYETFKLVPPKEWLEKHFNTVLEEVKETPSAEGPQPIKGSLPI